MALQTADRVQETSTTTGAGALTLAGAVAGFRAFSAVCSVGDTCFYAWQGLTAGGALSGEWEVGVGTYSAASTLTRTTVLASSNSAAAVNITSASLQVWIDLPSATQTRGFAAKAGNYTAVPGDKIAADTSAGAFAITLPASPFVGAEVQIVDAQQAFDINPLTVNPNGSKIAGLTQNEVYAQAGTTLQYIYSGATYGWLVRGGVGPYTGSRWNQIDSYLNMAIAGENGRDANTSYLYASGGLLWASMRANAASARSAGKLYFEFKSTAVSSFNPMIGVGNASASLASFVGNDANGWGMTLGPSGGSTYHTVATGQTVYALGDVCGIAVDFSGGTIQFYKNNVANGSYSGQTFGTLYPMYSANAAVLGKSSGTLRTKAVQCTYAPPSGYSYWDS